MPNISDIFLNKDEFTHRANSKNSREKEHVIGILTEAITLAPFNSISYFVNCLELSLICNKFPPADSTHMISIPIDTATKYGFTNTSEYKKIAQYTLASTKLKPNMVVISSKTCLCCGGHPFN